MPNTDRATHIRFSGRIQIVIGLQGELTDAWKAAWRDYDWDSDGEGRPDLRPELRVTERGTEIWFDWEEGVLETDTSAVITAIEASNHCLRNARAVEDLYRQQAESLPPVGQA